MNQQLKMKKKETLGRGTKNSHIPPLTSHRSSGITLIALIITIIVLLILAVVTIRTVTGDGILSYAKKAKETMEAKSIEEQIKLAVLSSIINAEDKIDETKLNDELTGYFGKDGYTLEGDSKSGWIIEVKGVSYSIDGNGNEIGPWRYAEITDEDGTVRTVVKNGTLILDIGEEINYDPTEGVDDLNKYSYGDYSLAEYKEKNPDLKWGILGVENGNLLISTIGNINNQKFGLRGKDGYANGINDLNAIGAVYGHGKGAEKGRSMTVEDINQVTGYNPNNVDQRDMNQTGTGNPYMSGSISQYGNKVTFTYESDTQTNYTWKKDEETIEGVYNNVFWYLKGDTWVKLEQGESVTLENTGYEYNYTTFIETSSEKNAKCIKMLFENTGGYYGQYWLASRFVFSGEGDARYDFFRVRYGVTCSSHLGHAHLVSSRNTQYNDSHYIRPVVVLRSDIDVVEDNGSLIMKF